MRRNEQPDMAVLTRELARGWQRHVQKTSTSPKADTGLFAVETTYRLAGYFYWGVTCRLSSVGSGNGKYE